jgi:hypothetical protein
MAHDTDQGVAYLMALKQSDPAATAAAPARETSPGVDASTSSDAAIPSQQFQGREKRRSPRFMCDGSAELKEDGCEVRTWASFTDISLHGCYVEAQATYPAGTKLYLKMSANGVRFETRGTVRVSYPYMGMGIAFVEMSEESQVRLKQVLAGISRPSLIMGSGVVSALSSHGSLTEIPLLSDPVAAVQALTRFFEQHHMLVRDDFMRILRESQVAKTR